MHPADHCPIYLALFSNDRIRPTNSLFSSFKKKKKKNDEYTNIFAYQRVRDLFFERYIRVYDGILS